MTDAREASVTAAAYPRRRTVCQTSERDCFSTSQTNRQTYSSFNSCIVGCTVASLLWQASGRAGVALVATTTTAFGRRRAIFSSLCVCACVCVCSFLPPHEGTNSSLLHPSPRASGVDGKHDLCSWQHPLREACFHLRKRRTTSSGLGENTRFALHESRILLRPPGRWLN